jgi:hypothetical protein
MTMSSENSSAAGAADDESRLDPWRELFRDRDIYDVISKAILVAATDSPQEFRRRRAGSAGKGRGRAQRQSSAGGVG